jgi:glycine hydroxymethyltransferase
VAGYTSYPWIPDWQKFREIADEVGAWLLADISHIAGLVAAKTVPSPIGIADVWSVLQPIKLSVVPAARC